MSYIEIYKEELRDLLDCGVCSQHLIIRDNEQGHTSMRRGTDIIFRLENNALCSEAVQCDDLIWNRIL